VVKSKDSKELPAESLFEQNVIDISILLFTSRTFVAACLLRSLALHNTTEEA